MKTLLLIPFLLFSFLSNAQIIITVAGVGGGGYSGDGGLATNAHLSSPYSVVLGKAGNLYMCDIGNSRVRKVSPAYNGTITTIAGNGTGGYSGDGYEAVYAQVGAVDVAIDWRDNIFLADGGNHCIRKVSPSGIITTYAGTGTAGYNGDNIAATVAELYYPESIAVDDTGNLYIADRSNNRIRRVDTFGVITTIAGNGSVGFSPDGSMADTASLELYYIRLDKNGVIFFTDNNRIRKIDTAGKLVTIAGTGVYGYSGDGGLATAAHIEGGPMTIDTLGNIFTAEHSNHVVRKIDLLGIITTVAGTRLGGYSGDWGNPLLAKLAGPGGIAVAPNGDIYIGDVGSNRVRMITTRDIPHPNSVNNRAIQEGIKIYPNPSGEIIHIEYLCECCTIKVTDLSGQQVQIGDVNRTAAAASVDAGRWANGIYIVQVLQDNKVIDTQEITIHH